MSKVAILISGYLRSFSDNFDNFQKKILSQFDDFDIYLHFTKNGDKDDKYLNFNKDLKELESLLNPKCILSEENTVFSNNKNIDNTYNLWLKYYKLFEIVKENVTASRKKYDLIIKWRPDLNLSTDFSFDEYKDGKIHIPLDSKIDKTKLVNKNDGYICDIFAFGNFESMSNYFDIYHHIPFLIEKYNTHVSESLLYYYLRDKKIPYSLDEIQYSVILSKCNVFAIAGDSGSGKSTLATALKKKFNNSFVLEGDRYHKWERGDENWKSYTHLNPQANYIAKMEEDIFDLKVGNTIYQVDYDHSTGKFTDKEEINSSDNLIVCGLHSLYTQSDRIYDLKIFIDTDQELRTKWKIERDSSKRGYKVENIIKQIESRKQDYVDFILPQRDNSDIVINFFPNNETTSLRLLIKKEFDIKNLMNIFEINEVNFEIKFDQNIFNEIIFTQYKKLDCFDSFQDHAFDFYDYIIYIILNLK